MEQTESTKRKPGRPKQNLAGKGDGNPLLVIRVPVWLNEAVKARGGSAWARKVIEEALKKEPEPQKLPLLCKQCGGPQDLCGQCR